MNLGAFSVSLAVEDLERSRSFYEKLGFEIADRLEWRSEEVADRNLPSD